MISVKNLFFIFLDMKGIGRAQAGFVFVFFSDQSCPATVET